MDKLMTKCNENGCYALGYTDGIRLPISGKFLGTVSQLLQEALSTVQEWCDRTQSIMDGASTIYQKNRFKETKGTKCLCGHTLRLTTEIKYLGLILKKKLK